jgi:Flp pilus assembly protein TadG
MFRLLRRDREKGASAVEFAIVLPLLLTLVFGIMEAGWLFAQQVEVRNAAREGARLAVVNYGSDATIRSATCDRAALSKARASVYLERTPVVAIVEVAQEYAPLVGFFPFFNNVTIRSTVEMRLEQDPAAWDWGPGPTAKGVPGADAGKCS